MRISIAMATYNGAKYLQEQLDSLLLQTHLPDELVICDDNSTDDTQAIIKRFAMHAPFQVKIFRNERNIGYTKNFSKAIERCTGDIIFMCDQDDLWDELKLEIIMKLYSESPDIMMICNDARISTEDMNDTGLSVIGQILSSGTKIDDYFAMGCCTSFHRDLLSVILPVPSDVAYDSWIQKIGTYMQCKKYYRKCLQFYRRHGTNASASPHTRTTKLSRLELLMDSPNNNNTSIGYFREAMLMRSVQDRMAKFSPRAKRGIDTEELLKHLLQRQHATEKRARLIELPRLKRYPAILRMMLNSEYRFFSGWKSVAKDLIR